MRIIHSKIAQPEEEQKQPKLTKKDIYHERMVAALRRRQYADFLKAGEDEEVKKAEALARSVNPDYQPKFNK